MNICLKYSDLLVLKQNLVFILVYTITSMLDSLNGSSSDLKH